MIDYYREIIGVISVIISCIASIIYIRSVLQGVTKPHIFTWVIWSAITWIAFLIQVAGNAGPGAWAMGVSALSSVVILLLSFKLGHAGITRFDKIIFSCTLGIIPIWLLTESLALSAIWITLIDVAAFYFTIRKSWHHPHQENGIAAILRAARNGLSICALSSFSIATALYPIVLTISNVILIAVIYGRRNAAAT